MPAADSQSWVLILVALIAALPALIVAVRGERRQKATDVKMDAVALEVASPNGHPTGVAIARIEEVTGKLAADVDSLATEVKGLRRDMYGLGIAFGSHFWSHDPVPPSESDQKKGTGG